MSDERNLKQENSRKIALMALGTSILLAAFFWLSDALFEFLWFNTGGNSLFAAILPLENFHELITRITFSSVIVLSGIVVSRAFALLVLQQQKAQENAENLRIILDSIGDAVIVTDVAGKVARMNPVAEALTGWGRRQAQGQDLSEVFRIIHSKSREPVANPVQKVVSTGEVVELSNHTILIARAGAEYHIADSAAPIIDKAREIRGVVLVFRDVSEAYATREELRESEKRFRTLVENIPGVSYRCAWDKAWTMEFISDEIETLSGYPATDFRLNQVRSYAEIIHPEDKPKVEEKVLTALARHSSFSWEYRILRADGQVRWVFEKGQGVFGEDGHPLCLDGVIIDVTERKLAEETLANEHRQLRKVLDYSFQIGIIATDATGMMTLFNAGAERMLGYQAEELIKKQNPSLFHIESEILAREKELSESYGYTVKGFEVFVAQARRGGYDEREWTYVRKDGSHLTVNLIVTAVRDERGKVTGFLGFSQDVTEKKRQEQELRRLRNYLANIIDSMPSILVGVDPDGQVTQWNEQASQKTGLPPKEAVGKPLNQVFPRLAQEMERVREAMSNRETLTDAKRAHQEQGERRFENITVYPLIANGVEGAVIRVDDVTDQVRIEEMMIQSEKMLSVGGLAAGMAHEINNPLGGMMQTASVMSDRLTNLDLPANLRAAQEAGLSMEALQAFMEARGIIKMLGRIRESGNRAAEIVSNMLSFARKSDSTLSSYSLVDLLEQTLSLAGSDYDLKKRFDFRTISIVREYEEEIPFVPCESGKIQQVLLNILRNGAEAMHEAHEGEKIARFTLRVAWEKARGMVRLEIEDNGPGMEEETRKRVFEPFFTTKPTDRGTGLGLSVSYFIIVENHHGEMQVKSQPGKGTRFIIRLPAERGEL